MQRRVVVISAPDRVESVVLDASVENFAGRALGCDQITFVGSIEFPTTSIVLVAAREEQERADARAVVSDAVLPPAAHREAKIYGRCIAIRVDVRGEPLDLYAGEFYFEAMTRAI